LNAVLILFHIPGVYNTDIRKQIHTSFNQETEQDLDF